MFINSKPLEEALQGVDVGGVVIGGYNGEERKSFVRLHTDYNIVYDRIYKDFVTKNRGIRENLSFKDEVFVIQSNGHLYDSLNSRIKEMISKL